MYPLEMRKIPECISNFQIKFYPNMAVGVLRYDSHDLLLYMCFCLLDEDKKQLSEHQARSRKADEQSPICRSRPETPRPVDNGRLPLCPGET